MAQTNPTAATDGLRALQADLARDLEGDLRFDAWTRSLYATDASIYRIPPLGVVFPKSAEDVIAAVTRCAAYGFPVLPRGDGSSLAGQTVGEAVILDFSRYMDTVTSVDAAAGTVLARPGISLARLNRRVRPIGQMFGPDPASADRATVGGIIGNNSTGSHSILYGMTSDHVRRLHVVLSDGSPATFEEVSWTEALRRAGAEPEPRGLEEAIYRTVTGIAREHHGLIAERFPKTWRRVGGYDLLRFRPGESVNLAHLVAGSEGTLCTVVEAELGLVPVPAGTGIAVLSFDGILTALSTVPAMLAEEPSAIELLDGMLLGLCRESLEYARKLTFVDGAPEAVLVIEVYGSDARERRDHLDRIIASARGSATGPMGARIIEAEAEKANVWDVRKAGLGLLMSRRGDHKPIPFIEDTAVPPERLHDYIADTLRMLDAHGTKAAFYAHASAGCLHIRPLINLKEAGEVERMAAIARASAELVLRYNGAMSGEHGDGLARSGLNRLIHGDEVYGLFEQVKDAADPHGRMNPGKIVRAPAMTEHLRFGADYGTKVPRTWFDFSADGGLDRAVEMCNGAGVCRKMDVGTMCPSFMATRDEEHSTRGRANALREVLSGRTAAQGLSDERLHQTLDLCLECKACKSECPSQVDMTRLKSEVLAHYQAEHGTSLRTRIFGQIAALSRLGSATAPVSNWIAGSVPVRWLLDLTLGIDRRRRLPRFERRTFRRRFGAHRGASPPAGGSRVWLLPDTFTNHNEPAVGMAAVRLLEAAGAQVELLPLPGGCCGRPMLSKGMLAGAKRMAERNLAVWGGLVADGTPILGLEPSCILTLTDEYPALVPGAGAEAVAASACTMEEWLDRNEERLRSVLAFRAPAGYDESRLLVHGHCHQKALVGTDPMRRVLEWLPDTSVQIVESGCCGMAGSFGYEKEHYELSLRIGRDRLFGAVEGAGEATVVAPGTSCRSQITAGTGRRALHPVEVLAERMDREERRNLA